MVDYFKSWLYEPLELAIEVHGFQTRLTRKQVDNKRIVLQGLGYYDKVA